MKQTKTVEETITKEEVISVVCNCCGKTETGKYIDYDSTITNLNINFGYGSRFDTDTWKMDICDDCLEKWTSSFKHPIEKMKR